MDKEQQKLLAALVLTEEHYDLNNEAADKALRHYWYSRRDSEWLGMEEVYKIFRRKALAGEIAIFTE